MESAVNTSRNDCGFMVGLSLLGPRGKKQNGGPSWERGTISK